MRKMKKIGAILAAATLSLGVCAFAACGDNGNDDSARTDAYTIIVTDANGNAISNLSIGICTYDETTHAKGECLIPEKTDANGKVVFDAADEAVEGVYTLNTDMLSDYQAQETYVFKDYGEYTVVLIAE
ncbi:MAG: hypothetical protein IJ329_01785 [Clostridia bacterium]|nr:hypothetical protein [Clostridia bacterium]